MSRLFERFAGRLINAGLAREPDFIIGGPGDPYLRRWFLIPRNRALNLYLHEFIRSDDDRALHDHPWANLSVLLRGSYLEHTISAGGTHHHRRLVAGQVRLRRPTAAHRVEITDGPCWTLFITGPTVRAWGFHCRRAWVPWQRFVAHDDRGSIGAGCGDDV